MNYTRIFSQLPSYIRRRVLKEGKILLCHNEDALYEVAFRTAQAVKDFKRIYYGYLDQIAHVGSFPRSRLRLGIPLEERMTCLKNPS